MASLLSYRTQLLHAALLLFFFVNMATLFNAVFTDPLLVAISVFTWSFYFGAIIFAGILYKGQRNRSHMLAFAALVLIDWVLYIAPQNIVWLLTSNTYLAQITTLTGAGGVLLIEMARPALMRKLGIFAVNHNWVRCGHWLISRNDTTNVRETLLLYWKGVLAFDVLFSAIFIVLGLSLGVPADGVVFDAIQATFGVDPAYVRDFSLALWGGAFAGWIYLSIVRDRKDPDYIGRLHRQQA